MPLRWRYGKKEGKGKMSFFFQKKGNQTVTKMETDGLTPKVLDVIYQQETFFSRFETVIILKATSTAAWTWRSWFHKAFFSPKRKWRGQTGQALQHKHNQSAKYQWLCLKSIYPYLLSDCSVNSLQIKKNHWHTTANHTTATNRSPLVLHNLAFVFWRNERASCYFLRM